MEAMLAKLLEGQQKMTKALNERLDSMYADLNGKLEALGTHLEELDVQVALAADSIKWKDEFLHAMTDTDPKRARDAIPEENKDYFDEFKAIFGVAELASIDTKELCRSTLEENQKSRTEELVSIDTSDRCRSTPAEEVASLDMRIDAESEFHSGVERHHPSVARHRAQSESKLRETPESSKEKVHTPNLPFPRARKSSPKVEEALSMTVFIENPPKEPRYELPVLISDSPAPINKNLNCEKTVLHSCKQRVSRKLGFSIDVSAGKRSNQTKVKPKRTSKPFAKIRIIIPSDLEEKEEEVIQRMMENTMKLFPGIVFDKSGGAAKKGRTKDRAATILMDKGGTILLEDPNA